MIFILVVGGLWGMFLSLFVLSPLFSSSKKMLASPVHFVHLETQKDFLFQKLIYGVCADKTIQSLSEKEGFERLVDVCERLDSVGKSWKPNLKKSDSGFFVPSFLLCLSIFLGVFTLFFSHNIFAQSQSKMEAPSSVTVPQSIVDSQSGYWVPAVNQFILIPEQGSLHVYYMGVFSNDTSIKSAKILLPFPKNVTKVSLQTNQNAVLEKTDLSMNILLNTPVESGVNQIQGEFFMPADSGTVNWQKNSLSRLPGVVIFIIPEDFGIVQNILSRINANLSIWPPRIVHLGDDFKTELSTKVLRAPSPNPDEKNGALSRQFVRVGEASAAYPQFKVVGIVPSRIYIYFMVIFFACFFAAAFLWRAVKYF